MIMRYRKNGSTNPQSRASPTRAHKQGSTHGYLPAYQLSLHALTSHTRTLRALTPACDRSRYLSPCSQSENGVPTAPAFPRVSASWTKSAIHAIAGGSGFPSHSFHKCNLWQPSLAQPTLASASLPAAEGLELCRHMASSYLIPLDIRAQMYTMYCMAVCKPSTKHRPSSVYGKRRTASTVVAPRRLAPFHVNIIVAIARR